MPKGVYQRKKPKGSYVLEDGAHWKPAQTFKHWEEMCREVEMGVPCLYNPGKTVCNACLVILPLMLKKRARERAVEDKEQAKSEALVRAMERSMVLRRTYAADGEIPPSGAVVVDAKG